MVVQGIDLSLAQTWLPVDKEFSVKRNQMATSLYIANPRLHQQAFTPASAKKNKSNSNVSIKAPTPNFQTYFFSLLWLAGLLEGKQILIT